MLAFDTNIKTNNNQILNLRNDQLFFNFTFRLHKFHLYIQAWPQKGARVVLKCLFYKGTVNIN